MALNLFNKIGVAKNVLINHHLLLPEVSPLLPVSSLKEKSLLSVSELPERKVTSPCELLERKVTSPSNLKVVRVLYVSFTL